MKIFLTEFTKEGQTYSGPRIFAPTIEEADLAAEELGVEVIGELEDVFVYDNDERVTIH
jgi:predicted RecB family endonuclease